MRKKIIDEVLTATSILTVTGTVAEKLSYRGEIISNNIKLASIEGQRGVHDSQVMVKKVGDYLRIIFLYRSSSNFHVVCRSPHGNELIYSKEVVDGGMVGWAPRMFEKGEDAIRIMYTKNKTEVYYKDLTINTGGLGVERPFVVRIKDSKGTYLAERHLTLDAFLQHVANVSGIDYRLPEFAAFAKRNVLVEDTQQIQVVGDTYYLTCQVLADSMPQGDTGGIACLMWSKDMETWHLNDPIRIGSDMNEQRDHEISATFLNGKWHALSRCNKYTFDERSGYRYYTSDDGNSWTFEGMSGIPKPLGGIRHAVFKYPLRHANPLGTSPNYSSQTVAFVLYQKIPSVDNITGTTDPSHRLRTMLGLCYTADFKNFTEVAEISDRANITYPSMYIYQDRLYMCFSSGFTGGFITASILWSSYNLGKL